MSQTIVPTSASNERFISACNALLLATLAHRQEATPSKVEALRKAEVELGVARRDMG
jgi:hypothetical protein